jgi:hypothetical protein
MHKFKVGNLIRISAGQGRKLAGAYEVVRLLPADETGTPIYQVKAAHESHMRVVAEHHIEPEEQQEVRIG